MDNCIFCKIISGEIPSATIYEDDKFKVILDRFPGNIGHVLILPKKHYSDIFEIDEDTAADLFRLAVKVAKNMKSVLGFEAMNVVQNIQAGMGRKPDPKKVREYITGFQLGGLEHHMPDQLSGGQKQRVAMARMLAAEPEVLLLDEPFAALDSYLKWKMEQQMLELLQKVQTPVLFVSHSRDEVYRLCDTVSCIHQGRMEVIEPVKEFFRNPKTKTAALLSGCKNICAVEAMESHRDGNWLWASDWGVGIRVSKEALQARTIGIRAHFFTKEKPSEGCYSEFPVGEYRIMEDPFEWNVSFRKDRSCEWLQWKTAKTDWDPSEGVPEKLYVKEENLLLLDIDTDNRR